MLTGDFNGDHRTDLAGWNDPSEAWHVALSTGQGFDPSAGYWITNFGHPGSMIVGDFGGSGRTSIGTYLYDSTTEQTILATEYSNPSYDTSRLLWASDVCSGHQWPDDDPPQYEWMQVLDPSSESDDVPVGISGIAVDPEISRNDMPFTHPFGFDWLFYVVPNAQYRRFLTRNNGGPDGEYVKATTRAQLLGLSVPNGVMGVETDQDLIPSTYRAMEGDRVLVFGRWIVDCGHNDFHSEIHPPLLMVTARPGGGAVDRNVAFPSSEATSSFLISRPWLVGQRFREDNKALRAHMIDEVSKVEALLSTRVEAQPIIRPPVPSPVVIGYRILPPSRRHSPNDRLLVNFHFTVRHGVAVQVYNAGSDVVGVLIVMNPEPPAPLPHRHDWDIPIEKIQEYYSNINLVRWGNIIAHPLAGHLLDRDWLTDRYDAPQASSIHDSEITRMPVTELAQPTPVSVDDDQPFPIYGQVRVQWERH